MLDAQLIAATWVDGMGYYFKVRFSDGHETDTYADSENDKYVTAFEQETAAALFTWTPEKPIYTLVWKFGEQEKNIWIIEAVDKHGLCYKIFYDNKRQFDVRKIENEWIADPAYHEEGTVKVDKDLFKKISSLTEYYHIS